MNRIYLHDKLLNVQILGIGYAWLDTGTIDSLVDATEFIQMLTRNKNIRS